MNKIAIVTDAWHPQINGVVTTLTQTAKHLEQAGSEVKVINPQLFRSIPCPTYPEIRLSLVWKKHLSRMLEDYSPNAVHIATEGPLGWAARAACRHISYPFTTSYHTRFPEYIRMRFPLPLSLSYKVVRGFHAPAVRVMVATADLRQELVERKFDNTVHWSRGVDTDLFKPREKTFLDLPRPILMYVGRVAVEKNLEALLQLDYPGSKVIVGDGPAKTDLQAKFPDAHFAGYQKGEALAKHVAAADVLSFPSYTDTFGIVMLEAMACGVPVAAYPVMGPINVVTSGMNGWLDDDLGTAIDKALEVSPETCRNTALSYSWDACTRQFFNNLEKTSQPFN